MHVFGVSLIVYILIYFYIFILSVEMILSSLYVCTMFVYLFIVPCMFPHLYFRNDFAFAHIIVQLSWKLCLCFYCFWMLYLHYFLHAETDFSLCHSVGFLIWEYNIVVVQRKKLVRQKLFDFIILIT